MNHTIKQRISAPSDCTGCALCANVCPKSAIEMHLNAYGFYQPEVNDTLCIDCGICTKSCIALTPPQKEPQKSTAYGAWSKDEAVQLKSSSGGIFSIIASHILQLDGCVFGVAWSHPSTAEFVKIENEHELATLRGSKYTQAKVGTIYQQVKKELQKERWVLFSGTPCQISALRKYLKKTYEKLVTIDIICHGVPSRLLLEKYISEHTPEGTALTHIDFRDKSLGWSCFSVKLYFQNGDIISHPLYNDSYMRLFLSDMLLNEACYACPFSQAPRCGDISLGDFWGVQNHYPHWPLDKGISAILVNTKQGENIWTQIAENVHSEEVDMHLFSKYQGGFTHNTPIPTMREKSLEILAHTPLPLCVSLICDTKYIGPFRINKKGILFKTLRWVKRGLLEKFLR